MESFDACGVTGIVWRRVDPTREAEAEHLMKELLTLSRATRGFLGSEIFPPIPGVQDAYVVLYRYERGEHLRQWLRSTARAEVLSEMEAFLREPAFEFFFAHQPRTSGSASTIMSYRVKDGFEEEFQHWRSLIHEATRVQPGFLGVEIHDSRDSADRSELVVIVRFENRPALDGWMGSDQRAELMNEGEKFVEDHRIRKIGSGFEGWFDVAERQSPPAPWRQGLVILSVLFPVIMILREVFAFLFVLLPFPAAFLILLAIDVALLTYVIMPHFSRLMGFWLRPGPTAGWKPELTGWLVVLGLPALTLAVALWTGSA